MDIFSFFIIAIVLYCVVYLAVKHAINDSRLGKLIIERLDPPKQYPPVSDEEIRRMLENDHQ